MWSKEEAQRLKKEFWTEFAQAYPRKWLLYDTKIKDFSLKFHADNKKAEVMIAVEHKDPEKRLAYWNKLLSLKTILLEDYVSDAYFQEEFQLDNKIIGKVWTELHGVSMHNRATWPTIYDFFNEKMNAFELFFYEFEDFIKDIEIDS